MSQSITPEKSLTDLSPLSGQDSLPFTFGHSDPVSSWVIFFLPSPTVQSGGKHYVKTGQYFFTVPPCYVYWGFGSASPERCIDPFVLTYSCRSVSTGGTQNFHVTLCPTMDYRVLPERSRPTERGTRCSLNPLSKHIKVVLKTLSLDFE